MAGNKGWRAFVLMSFADHHKRIFTGVLVPVLEKAGYVVERADSTHDLHNIIRRIVQGIDEADLVVVDITDLRSNVMYELGLAHALLKPTVILMHVDQDIPFDLRPYKVIRYSDTFDRIDDLKSELLEIALKHMAGQVQFDNPVKDFAASVQKTTSSDSPNNKANTGSQGNFLEVEVVSATFTRRMLSISERIQGLSGMMALQLVQHVGINGIEKSPDIRLGELMAMITNLASIITIYVDQTRADVEKLRNEWRNLIIVSEQVITLIPYPAGMLSEQTLSMHKSLSDAVQGIAVMRDSLRNLKPQMVYLADSVPDPHFTESLYAMNSVHDDLETELSDMEAALIRDMNLLEFRLSG